MIAMLYIIGGAALGIGIAAFFSNLMKKHAAAQKKKQDEAYERNIQEKIRKHRNKNPGDPNSVVQNDITGVGLGGVFRLPRFGNQDGPVDLYVTRIHRYNNGGNNTWYELICNYKGRELLCEWYRKGKKLHVTAGFEDECMEEDDIGLTEEKLIDFDEGKLKTFEWQNQTWIYLSSGESFYYEDDEDEAEGFYLWSFENSDGSETIDIEKWEDDDEFCVYHEWAIDPKKIEVFDAGKGRR